MKQNHIVIGIEGLVGAGKTSICRELLEIIPNSILLHGGNLYRAIVYTLLASGKSIEELGQEMKHTDINQFIEKLGLEIKVHNRQTVIYIKGEEIPEKELQSQKASYAVSAISEVADNTALFQYGKELINQLKQDYSVIFSGRAIMQIYPQTDYHFLITASFDERVKRKCIQYENQEEKEKVAEVIKKRDAMQEKAGFYDRSPNTIIVDVTDCKTVKESTQKVASHIVLEREE